MHDANAHKVTVALGERMSCNSSSNVVKQAVQKISIEAWKSHIERMPTLPEARLQSAKSLGSKTSVIGHDGSVLSGNKLMAAVWSFSGKLKKHLPGKNIGLLLPPSSGGVIANLGVLTLGKVIVNLNYTANPDTLVSYANAANIKIVLYSRQFVKKLEGKGFDVNVLQRQVKFLYLEDIKGEISKLTLLRNLLISKFFPRSLLSACFLTTTQNTEVAAILFSYGSERTPKGVELTHQNIVGNCKQTSAVLNPNENDSMLCTLALFHTFGLSITTFMPLIEGIPLVTYPDPTDAKGIGKTIAQQQVSILCGTSTFLIIYTQSNRVLPLMFASIRMVVAGAERLRPEVRDQFKQKFGLDIYEGYGCTETTPVASVNIPDHLLDDYKTIQVGNKRGTVGLPLPSTQFRIVDPDTKANLEAGTDSLILIGGEMIYLGAVETLISQHWDTEAEYACTAIPSTKKEDELVLLTTATLSYTQEICKNLPPLTRPNLIFPIDEIPKLGSGKVNLKELKTIALALT